MKGNPFYLGLFKCKLIDDKIYSYLHKYYEKYLERVIELRNCPIGYYQTYYWGEGMLSSGCYTVYVGPKLEQELKPIQMNRGLTKEDWKINNHKSRKG